MIERLDGNAIVGPSARTAPYTATGSTQAQRFSSALAAHMSRASIVRADYSGGDDLETPDPEPIKASAPIITVDAKRS